MHPLRSTAAAAALLGCLSIATGQPDLESLRRQVADTERALAKSMADRDLAAFERHLSEHALFFDGGTPLRGKAAVIAAWKDLYQGAQAPFSWAPDQVEVLADGTLAHSSGLVRNPAGKPVGRFNSVWRQEAPGVWRIVFDKGSPLTEADKEAAAKP
jgi:ketosteroid isomerase-like protein